MRSHPYADRFPMLDGEALDRLSLDIRENGLQHPIVLDSDGRILDGRNRWAACEIAGVKPETVLYRGNDLAAFVLSVNVSRRHLSTGQQAMSTALVLSDTGARENGRWKRGSLIGTSDIGSKQWAQRMAEAGVILDFAADLAESVANGEKDLNTALREAERRRDAERDAMAEVQRMKLEEEENRAKLVDLAPEYLAALDAGEYRSASAAYADWEQDNRVAAAKARRDKAERDAEESRRRKDMTVTFTNMAEALQRVNSIGRSPFDKYIERFDPTYFDPPSLLRELEPEQLRKGIAFMNSLLAWKEARDV